MSVAQTGDSDLLGRRAHQTANRASFICSMLHSGYKVIGYMFAKQSYWYKLRGLLFKFKAILLVQTVRAFFKLRRPQASQLSPGLFTGCTLIGRLQVTRWGRGIPPFHGNRNPSPGPLPVLAACQPWPPASPGPLPAPALAAPHNKTFFFSASKTNKKNIRHMNYRHW